MTMKDMEPKEIENLPNPPIGMPRIMPHLFYHDVGAAMDWLTSAFGFVVRNRLVDRNGKVVHGDLEVADSLVMLGLTAEHEHWESPESFQGKIISRLFIYVDDVDAHYQRAKAAGADIHSKPGDQFYGERVYEAIDLEGHRWKFAQPIFVYDQHSLERPED